MKFYILIIFEKSYWNFSLSYWGNYLRILRQAI